MKGFWLLLGFVLLAVLSKAQDPSGLAAQPGYDWYKYKFLSATEGFYNAQRDTTWKPVTAGAQVFAHNTTWLWDGSRWRNDADGIKPEWFGAKGDSTTDDADKLQAAVNYASTSRNNVVTLSNGRYVLGHTVTVPYNVSIIGQSVEGVKFLSKAGGSYFEADGSKTNTGFLFFWNVDTANTSTWIQQFPNRKSGRFQNCTIDGAPTGAIKGIYFAGTMQFSDIQCQYVSTLIQKPGVYADAVSIRNIHAFNRANNTDFLINLPGLGDAVNIQNVASGYTATTSYVTYNVFLGPTMSAQVFGLINGVSRFQQSQAVNISGSHIERGYFILDACDANVHDNLFFTEGDSLSGIHVTNSQNSNLYNFSVVIKDNQFDKMPNGRDGWSTTEKADIVIESPSMNVVLENNTRAFIANGNISNSQIMAALVGNLSGVYPDWLHYSYMLAVKRVVVNSDYINVTGTTEYHSFTWNGISQVDTVNRGDPAITWSGTTGTYYYTAQLIIDPVRMLGRNTAGTAEYSISIVNGGQIPEIFIDKANIKRSGGYFIRLYRGTSSGSYDKYVDIPAINVRRIWDDGNAANTFAWQSRTAGAVDVLNNAGWSGQANYNDNSITLYGVASTPTTGTWNAGDVLYKTNASIDTTLSYSALYGYLRITTGSTNVLGADWLSKYVRTNRDTMGVTNFFLQNAGKKVWFKTNALSVTRTQLFPDKDGTIALTTDINTPTITAPIVTSGTAPTIAVGGAAGTGATASVSGNNMTGTITLNTGTSTTSGGILFTVTFNGTLASSPTVIIQGFNDIAVLHTSRYGVTSTTTTTFVVRDPTSGTALTASSTYLFKYWVIQ